MKVYTVVCNYILDGHDIKIELSKMLKRLNLVPKAIIFEGVNYGIDYGVNDVIKYNVEKAYKVKYMIWAKKIKKTLGLFEYDSITKELTNFVNTLNEKHDEMIFKLPKEEFEIKYRYYGDNYTEQTKRR